MSPSSPSPNRVRTVPYVLLGLLTIATFGGPLAIILVGRGGRNPFWPPDRPIEWATFGIVCVVFLGLFSACLIDGALAIHRQRRRHDDSSRTDRAEDVHASTSSETRREGRA